MNKDKAAIDEMELIKNNYKYGSCYETSQNRFTNPRPTTAL
jgi:hypothetical protein